MEILVKDFIFCDDIRVEEGKKFSVMGTYADKIKLMPNTENIQKFRLPISAFIRFVRLSKKSEFYFNISINFEKANIAKIEGTLDFRGEKFSTLPIARIELDIERSGTLGFQIEMKDKDKATVLNHEEVISIIIEKPLMSSGIN